MKSKLGHCRRVIGRINQESATPYRMCYSGNKQLYDIYINRFCAYENAY